MLAFDPRELRNADVHIAPLPDEQGLLIDARTLPCAFPQHLSAMASTRRAYSGCRHY